MGKYNSRKRKTKKNIPAGEVHIHSTFNNTIVTITDLEGNVVSWASAGTQGVKGSKKSTPFAAGLAAEKAGKMAYDAGMRKVEVEVLGVGPGREQFGLSWTKNIKTAKWFANRWNNKNPYIIKAQCFKKDIFAYFNERSEDELVVNVKKIINIERIQL